MRLIDSEPPLKEIRRLEEIARTFEHPYYRLGYISALYVVEDTIASEDKIDAEPVRHGRWIYDVNAQDWGIGGFMCSECGAVNKNLPVDDKIHVSWFVGSKYCPDCGAKMDEEVEK